jgi:pyruvate dehydrogenase E1 component alpha subunit
MYRKMTLIKQNDERFRSVIKSGKLVMPYYSPRGQEVIPSAMSVHLTPEDYICTIYRGVHDMLAKGVPMKPLWAELAGKVTGTCKGKGGPMHITHPESGVMVTTGVVGSSMPIANGLALAAQIRGESRVTVAYFGDGASNIGAFHEALNLASVWKLPVVFVCENNLYMEYTPIRSVTAVEHPAADRAASYGLPAIIIDGNDVDSVYLTARAALARARAGDGPSLIECKTYRHSGHSRADPAKYRPAVEVESWLERDPLPTYRARLLTHGVPESNLSDIERDVLAAVDRATEASKASPPPALDSAFTDVWADGGAQWRN